MDKTIKIRVKKEIDNCNELKVLKLKGSLITKGYTEIIHMLTKTKIVITTHFLLHQPTKKRQKILY